MTFDPHLRRSEAAIGQSLCLYELHDWLGLVEAVVHEVDHEGVGRRRDGLPEIIRLVSRQHHRNRVDDLARVQRDLFTGPVQELR